MKRILGKKSALATAVGSSLMGAMLVGALAGCASTTSTGTTGSDSTTSDGTSTSSTSATGTSDVSSTYKDGTYSADGSYSSPDGQEEIAVTLTVKSNTVTAVSVTSVSANGEGRQYQAIFESGISSVVVGRELATLSVSNVAGSSLTSQGFNAALATIRADAKS
ncbi:MAG TPA: hypothetical protein VHX87_12960 [Galbitalea sp.]|jgi:uncharacterized protein with FMN-binding domain|nr:hypothetical protein [Galbitalea sp.]